MLIARNLSTSPSKYSFFRFFTGRTAAATCLALLLSLSEEDFVARLIARGGRKKEENGVL